MKQVLRGCLYLLIVTLGQSTYADNSLSPVGYWKTIDDVTGKGKAIVRIYPSGNGLNGQIMKTFPTPGQKPHVLCTACSGSKHNQPILGMVILEGLKQNKEHTMQWSGGSILDPLNGKTYRCTATVINHGKQLNVRGYIGIALFGRSQTWQRVN